MRSNPLFQVFVNCSIKLLLKFPTGIFSCRQDSGLDGCERECGGSGLGELVGAGWSSFLQSIFPVSGLVRHMCSIGGKTRIPSWNQAIHRDSFPVYSLALGYSDTRRLPHPNNFRSFHSCKRLLPSTTLTASSTADQSQLAAALAAPGPCQAFWRLAAVRVSCEARNVCVQSLKLRKVEGKVTILAASKEKFFQIPKVVPISMEIWEKAQTWKGNQLVYPT